MLRWRCLMRKSKNSRSVSSQRPSFPNRSFFTILLFFSSLSLFFSSSCISLRFLSTTSLTFDLSSQCDGYTAWLSYATEERNEERKTTVFSPCWSLSGPRHSSLCARLLQVYALSGTSLSVWQHVPNARTRHYNLHSFVLFPFFFFFFCHC